MTDKVIILALMLILPFTKLLATGQFGDKFVIGRDTFWIKSNPLETYFDKKGSRTINNKEMQGSCTALWRGYVATWQLQNDSLFLTRIQTNYCGKNPIDLDVKKEFGTNKVFSNWVNNTIVQAKGELIQYVHMGYMSIYEQEIYYKFEKGKIKNKEIKKYVEYNDKQILPAERKLSDTIKKLILREITINEREQFDKDSTCSINIIFGIDGEIKNIKMSYNQQAQNQMEEIILKKAKVVLANFPRLMKVTHRGYYPPTIDLFFNGHCLKNPKDRKYGCDEE